MDTMLPVVITGIGATALTDLWSLARRQLLGVPLPDFGMVGRWFGHALSGTFGHPAMARARPIRGERLLGWTVHYLIGVAFAALLPALWGDQWFARPSLWPAIGVGAFTVLAPFLILHPGMGLGVAARHSATPWRARSHSLLTHLVFGLGLYLSAWAGRALNVSG